MGKIVIALTFFMVISSDVFSQNQGKNLAKNNGQRIHYKVAGEGTPIVLLFGFGMSLEEWFEFGYADEIISNGFMVLAIEPRGHGRSDSPLNSDSYSIKQLATDVTAVLDDAGIEKTHILAYSLGAKIALGVIDHFPERMKSLTLGGFEIASEVDLSNDIVTSTLQSGAKKWRQLWESLFDIPHPMKERLENINTEALIALRQKESAWNSFEPYLRSIQVPVFLFVGENCFTKNDMKIAHNLIGNSELIVVSEEEHFSLIGSMDSVIKKALFFIEENA